MTDRKNDTILKEELRYSISLPSSALLLRISVKKGLKEFVWDVENKRYIDLSGSMGIISLGYQHPYFNQLVKQQLENIIHYHDFPSEVKIELFKELQGWLPHRLKRFQLFTGGSETVEAAMRLVRSRTNDVILAFYEGFHGKTFGSLSLCGMSFRNSFESILPSGSHLMPFPDCCSCSLGLKASECSLNCLILCRNYISKVRKGKIGGIFLEPIQGTTGNVFPTPEFFRFLRDIHAEYGVPLIFDEILTGIGKTGEMFAFQNYDTVPDVLLLGKGLGNGIPIGCLVCDENMLTKDFCSSSSNSTSFSGNLVGAVAALATLQTIKKERLLLHAKRIGKLFMKGLIDISERYPMIANVRGKGLLIGFDLVDGQKLANESILNKFLVSLMKKGVLVLSSSPRIRINPPLCISRRSVELVLEALEKSVGEMANNKK